LASIALVKGKAGHLLSRQLQALVAAKGLPERRVWRWRAHARLWQSLPDAAWWRGVLPGRGEIVMRFTATEMTASALACAAALVLAGCGVAADDDASRRAVDLSAPVDSATYAGDVAFRIGETFRAEGQDIPFSVYLGLAPETPTRLGGKAFVDLRGLQAALPDLLSGTIEPSCGLGLDLRFEGAEAEGDTIRARASADARAYRCRQRGTEDESRGVRLLAQTIDIDATLRGSLAGECIAFQLVDLELEPKGLLGGLATLFGVTERARAAILVEARTTLAGNPVCPDLPPALAILAPRLSAASLREIGEGGIGAALSGSVDVTAATLVDLLALVAADAPRRVAVADAAPAGQAAVRIDDSVNLRGVDAELGLDIRLAALGETRIGIETLLDLRDLQARLPEIVAGEMLVDTCGGRITLSSLEAEGREATVVAMGRLEVENFACERTGPGSWERGALLNAEEVGVLAEMSAEFVGDCVVFRLFELRRDPPGAFAQIDTGSGRMEAARALLFDAVGLVLEESPLCPDMPPEIAVLDPQFDRGTPQEIGTGGLGIAFDGSIDASSPALVDLLRLLQARGALPPPP
jgi:hypothetical protein